MGLDLTACAVTDLSNLCKLLSRVRGALEPLVSAFEEHVKNKGMTSTLARSVVHRISE